uniref:Bromo domain-containing protein n=1 Tax=Plectus sambesii TaxID=2011161 RepID=A0A914W8I2_9BILA
MAKRKSSNAAPPASSTAGGKAGSSAASSGGLKIVLRVPKKKVISRETTPSIAASKQQSTSSDDESDNEPLIDKIPDNSASKVANLEESDDNNDGKADESGSTSTSKPKRRKRRFRLTDSVAKAKRRADRKAMQPEKGSTPPKDEEEEEEEEKEEEESELTMPMPSRERLTSYSPMQLLADVLLRDLGRKDPDQYFTFPVTESIAPDYSSVIKQPMDLFTMRQKLDRNEYSTVEAIKKDVELIISNALVYNEAGTIYHCAAQKLKTVASYLFSQRYLLFVYHSLPFTKDLTKEQLGFDPEYQPPVAPNRPTTCAQIADDMTANAIIEQCKHASEKVAKRLAARKHKSHVSICFPGLSAFVEDRGNLAVPVSYLDYGPYASFAPQYDSTWATLNKRDSDLLLSTYGDQNNATYALSMRQFAESAGDRMVRLVDDMLDTLTAGEHRKAMKALHDSEKTPSTEADNLATDPIDFDSLQSLENLGFDVSFLDGLKKQFGPETDKSNGSKSVSTQLKQTGRLLADLELVQRERLGRQPEFTLTHTEGPNESEAKLAGAIVDNLRQLVAQTSPAALVTDHNLHAAMGIVDPASPGDIDLELLREFLTVPDAD